MDNIPTAKEFIAANSNGSNIMETMLINFAKMHVKEALQEALKNHDVDCPKYAYGFLCHLDEDSIINAYPETKIK